MRWLLLISTLVAGIAVAPTSYVRGDDDDDDDDRWEEWDDDDDDWFRDSNRSRRESAREWERYIRDRDKRARERWWDEQKRLRDQWERYGRRPYDTRYRGERFVPGPNFEAPAFNDGGFQQGVPHVDRYEPIPPPLPDVSDGEAPGRRYNRGPVWVPEQRAYRPLWWRDGAYYYGDPQRLYDSAPRPVYGPAYPSREGRIGASIGSRIGEVIGGPEGAAIGAGIGEDIGADFGSALWRDWP
jgi:hypothetical protein